ncbi:uncharacterized protein AAEQ78_021020 [Lycaon pictus]
MSRETAHPWVLWLVDLSAYCVCLGRLHGQHMLRVGACLTFREGEQSEHRGPAPRVGTDAQLIQDFRVALFHHLYPLVFCDLAWFCGRESLTTYTFSDSYFSNHYYFLFIRNEFCLLGMWTADLRTLRIPGSQLEARGPPILRRQNQEARAPGVRHQAGFHPLPSKSCRWQLDTRLRTNRGEQSALGRSPTTIQGAPLQGRGGEGRGGPPSLYPLLPGASQGPQVQGHGTETGAPWGPQVDGPLGPGLCLPCPFRGPFLGRGTVHSGTGLGRCPLVSLSAGLGLPLLPWAPPGGNVCDLVSRAHMHLDHPLDMGLPGIGVPQCTGRWAPGGRRGPSPTESGSQRPGPGGQPGAAAPRPHLYWQQPPHGPYLCLHHPTPPRQPAEAAEEQRAPGKSVHQPRPWSPPRGQMAPRAGPPPWDTSSQTQPRAPGGLPGPLSSRGRGGDTGHGVTLPTSLRPHPRGRGGPGPGWAASDHRRRAPAAGPAWGYSTSTRSSPAAPSLLAKQSWRLQPTPTPAPFSVWWTGSGRGPGCATSPGRLSAPWLPPSVGRPHPGCLGPAARGRGLLPKRHAAQNVNRRGQDPMWVRPGSTMTASEPRRQSVLLTASPARSARPAAKPAKVSRSLHTAGALDVTLGA